MPVGDGLPVLAFADAVAGETIHDMSRRGGSVTAP